MLNVAKKLARNTIETGPVLIIRKKAYEEKFRNNKELNLFKGVYANFAGAKAAIDTRASASYDNIDSAKLYKSFCEKLFPGDYPNLFWLSKIIPQAKSLFDLGGHIGVKYYSYQRYLDLPADFSWGVHDLPAVMKEGEVFAKENDPRSRLKFEKNLKNAAGYDILCAFGSLQYIDIDLAAEISQFPTRPRYVLATIPASDRKTYYTLNSIGTAQCPYIIRNQAEFIDSFKKAGYKLAQSWIIPDKKCEIPFHEGYSLQHYSGHLFELED